MKLTKFELDYIKKYKIDKKAFARIKKYYNSILESNDFKIWLNIFEENPYKLMDMEGYGFKRVDNLAQKIVYDFATPK